jgi:3-oxoacyl-[acyl-carrier protein] reductase
LTVVITGGTGGLGRQLVERLSQNSRDIIFTCGRDRKALAELSQLRGVHAYYCDVSDEGSVQNFATSVGSVLHNHGLEGVDVLINNAGLQVWGHPFFEMSEAIFDKSWKVNVRGPFFCAKAFFPHLSRSTRRGRIINIGSTVEEGPLAQAYHGVYAMSKAALTRFSNVMFIVYSIYFCLCECVYC